jgi:hypothetical protein
LTTVNASRLTFLRFEEWITHVFDHEVTDPQWYFEPDADYWQAPSPVTLEYVTRLFEDPAPVLGLFSDEQINQGLWYLVSSSASDHMFALQDEEVPLDIRCRCVRAFAGIFGKVFAVRCSDHLSHLDEPGVRPLNGICYMWWDVLPLYGRSDIPARRPLDEECLNSMDAVLRLGSIACQESALHGLGHWAAQYPQRVREIIELFVQSHPGLRAELTAYAASASRGCIL